MTLEIFILQSSSANPWKEREADQRLKWGTHQQNNWRPAPRRRYLTAVESSVSVSCVASSAGASEGWWTTCTEITRTTSHGGVTSVVRGQLSSRLCTDTSSRNMWRERVPVRFVGRDSAGHSQCYFMLERWGLYHLQTSQSNSPSQHDRDSDKEANSNTSTPFNIDNQLFLEIETSDFIKTYLGEEILPTGPSIGPQCPPSGYHTQKKGSVIHFYRKFWQCPVLQTTTLSIFSWQLAQLCKVPKILEIIKQNGSLFGQVPGCLSEILSYTHWWRYCWKDFIRKLIDMSENTSENASGLNDR